MHHNGFGCEENSNFNQEESYKLWNIISFEITDEYRRKKELDTFFLSDVSRINTLDHRGRTPLYLACMCDNDFVVDYLCERGAQHVSNQNGDYPIHAIESLPLLEKLLQKFDHININMKNSENKTLKDIITRALDPLRSISKSNSLMLDSNPQYTEERIDEKTALLNYLQYYKSEELRMACVAGEFNKINLLLQQGAQHAANQEGNYLIHSLDQLKHVYTINFLVGTCGVDVNQQNTHGKTLLDIIRDRSCSHEKIAGITIDTIDSERQNQLKEDLDFIQLLEEHLGAKTTKQLEKKS